VSGRDSDLVVVIKLAADDLTEPSSTAYILAGISKRDEFVDMVEYEFVWYNIAIDGVDGEGAISMCTRNRRMTRRTRGVSEATGQRAD